MLVLFVATNSETEKLSDEDKCQAMVIMHRVLRPPRISPVRVSRTYTLLRTIFHIRGTAGQRIVHSVAGYGRACAREFHFHTTMFLGLNVYWSTTKIIWRQSILYWPYLDGERDRERRDLMLRTDNALGQNWLDRHWEICVHWRSFCIVCNDLNVGVDVVTFG